MGKSHSSASEFEPLSASEQMFFSWLCLMPVLLVSCFQTLLMLNYHFEKHLARHRHLSQHQLLYYSCIICQT